MLKTSFTRDAIISKPKKTFASKYDSAIKKLVTKIYSTTEKLVTKIFEKFDHVSYELTEK